MSFWVGGRLRQLESGPCFLAPSKLETRKSGYAPGGERGDTRAHVRFKVPPSVKAPASWAGKKDEDLN